MITLQKWDKTTNAEGTTLTYKATRDDGLVIYIQSRKRHILHANGQGTWDHTTYFVIYGKGQHEKEFYSLKDAKEWADTQWRD